MNSRVLTPGDLARGQHVTVLDPIEDEKKFGPGHADTLLLVGGGQDWRGVPLEVLVVDLPFVLLRTAGDQRLSLDTRRHRFMEIKLEFWQALNPRPDPVAGVTFADVVSAHNQLAELVANHSATLGHLHKAVTLLTELRLPQQRAACPPPAMSPTPTWLSRLFRRGRGDHPPSAQGA